MEYLDARDLQERLEELESEKEDLETALEDAKDSEKGGGGDNASTQTAEDVLEDWKAENMEELKALRELKDEVCEWDDGNLLVPEADWIDYVRELLADIGVLPSDLPWYIEIDWEKTAENIAQDYGTVDYLGTTYYYRY